jgi:hypothetical protein
MRQVSLQIPKRLHKLVVSPNLTLPHTIRNPPNNTSPTCYYVQLLNSNTRVVEAQGPSNYIATNPQNYKILVISTFIQTKSSIYQLMHNIVALKEY